MSLMAIRCRPAVQSSHDWVHDDGPLMMRLPASTPLRHCSKLPALLTPVQLSGNESHHSTTYNSDTTLNLCQQAHNLAFRKLVPCHSLWIKKASKQLTPTVVADWVWVGNAHGQCQWSRKSKGWLNRFSRRQQIMQGHKKAGTTS